VVMEEKAEMMEAEKEVAYLEYHLSSIKRLDFYSRFGTYHSATPHDQVHEYDNNANTNHKCNNTNNCYYYILPKQRL